MAVGDIARGESLLDTQLANGADASSLHVRVES
jgi:hypothetical protein